jgi:hypothetical protein
MMDWSDRMRDKIARKSFNAHSSEGENDRIFVENSERERINSRAAKSCRGNGNEFKRTKFESTSEMRNRSPVGTRGFLDDSIRLYIIYY